jgi:hypothetical protein
MAVVLALTLAAAPRPGAQGAERVEAPAPAGVSRAAGAVSEPPCTLRGAEIAEEATPASASVSMEPITSTVRPGDTFTVSVVITDVVNLGAFQFTLHYDPAVVHVDDARLGRFLGSSGRNANPLGPTIDNLMGWVTFGAFSFGTQPGAEGGGVLAQVILTAQDPGRSALELDPLQILTPAADPLPVTVMDGAAVVQTAVHVPLVLRGGG